MSHVAKWLVKDKVIHLTLVGDLKVNDLSLKADYIHRMLDRSNQLVHLVVNEAQVESFPTSLRLWADLTPFLRHERLGWLVIYGKSEVSQVAMYLSTAFQRLTHVQLQRCTTLDKSLEFLANEDASLPPISELVDMTAR